MQFNFIFKQPGYNHEKLSKMNNFDNFTFFVQYFFFLFYADMGAHKYIYIYSIYDFLNTYVSYFSINDMFVFNIYIYI